jgi:hypothetical protein
VLRALFSDLLLRLSTTLSLITGPVSFPLPVLAHVGRTLGTNCLLDNFLIAVARPQFERGRAHTVIGVNLDRARQTYDSGFAFRDQNLLEVLQHLFFIGLEELQLFA